MSFRLINFRARTKKANAAAPARTAEYRTATAKLSRLEESLAKCLNYLSIDKGAQMHADNRAQSFQTTYDSGNPARDPVGKAALIDGRHLVLILPRICRATQVNGSPLGGNTNFNDRDFKERDANITRFKEKEASMA